MLTLGFVLKEMVDLAGRAVIGYDSKAFVVHVQDKILTLKSKFF